MNRFEIMKALLDWPMRIGLSVLELIATVCAFVGLRSVGRALWAQLSPSAIGVFAFAAMLDTSEAQKRNGVTTNEWQNRSVFATSRGMADTWRNPPRSTPHNRCPNTPQSVPGHTPKRLACFS